MLSGSKPWWKKGYELGLDAPLIAVIWLYIFAETWRLTYHPKEIYIALFLIIWALRVGCRTLSYAMTQASESEVELPRKRWRVVIFSGAVIGLGLLVAKFPLYGYSYLLVAGGFLTLFVVLSFFSQPVLNQVSYGKHIVAGLGFAFGIALMAHAYLPPHGMTSLFFSPEFVSFAVLLLIASSAVDHWGIISRSGASSEVNIRDEITLSLPLTLLAGASLVLALKADAMSIRPFFYSILTAAASLQVLNRMQHRFSETQIKALAVVCLVFPVLVFYAYGLSR